MEIDTIRNAVLENQFDTKYRTSCDAPNTVRWRLIQHYICRSENRTMEIVLDTVLAAPIDGDRYDAVPTYRAWNIVRWRSTVIFVDLDCWSFMILYMRRYYWRCYRRSGTLDRIVYDIHRIMEIVAAVVWFCCCCCCCYFRHWYKTVLVALR